MPIINSLDIVEVENKRVTCDGGGGALGHPQVYLEMGKNIEVTCPYCSRSFRLKNNFPSNSEG